MTDTTVITLVAAIPTTIAAVGSLLVSLVNAKKADAIAGKVDAVHVLTNSNLSAVTSALQVANTRIEGLEKLVATMTAANVATVAAVAVSAAIASPKPQ